MKIPMRIRMMCVYYFSLYSVVVCLAVVLCFLRPGATEVLPTAWMLLSMQWTPNPPNWQVNVMTMMVTM